MFCIVSSLRASHQLEHQSALGQGLYNFGVQAKNVYSIDQVKTKYVACWGWRKGKQLLDRGHDVLVMERGYVGDRFFYTSLGWNGLNGHAEFPEYPDDGGERFKAHDINIKPWSMGGDYALILGQVPNDASLKGIDMVPWYEEKAKEISYIYNIPVHFRPHPDLKKKGINQTVKYTIPSIGTLDEALSGAKFTVCYNSNSSVDSLLNGIPCVVGDKGSMAYDLCGKTVSDIIYPDREKWAHKLAQKQWTIEEIKSGEALKGIVCKLG